MTDSPDLARFLLDRLDEIETVARKATPGPWHWEAEVGDYDDEPPDLARHNEWGHAGPDLHSDGGGTVITSTGYDADHVIVYRADAAHIALHDPAAVLADCRAKRAIVERHLRCEDENRTYGARFDRYAAYAEQGHLDPEDPDTAAAFAQGDPELPPRTTTPFEAGGLRVTVRLLAQPFRDHAGFDPAWRLDD